MALRTPSHGLVTYAKAMELCILSFRTNITDAPDRVRDGGGNNVGTVVRDSAGTYTVTLNKPYPRQLVGVVPGISVIAAATTHYDVRYIVDSYSASTGAFQLQVVLNDGSNAVEDPPDNSVISVVAGFIPPSANSLVQD